MSKVKPLSKSQGDMARKLEEIRVTAGIDRVAFWSMTVRELAEALDRVNRTPTEPALVALVGGQR